jgi:hypothetical protein
LIDNSSNSTITTNNQPGREVTPAVVDTASVIINRYSKDFTFTSLDVNPTDYDEIVEPKSYNEAWNHQESKQQVKWRKAIAKEFNDMVTRKVWKKMKRQDIPSGRRCVKTKWVMKIKRNGVFRARLVACGYSQIPGVDFTENYAPVINDVTYRIILFASMVWGLETKIINFETAFLHRDLEQEIYMDCPEGLKSEPDECVILLKTIYGLLQSARQFFKKLIKTLKDLGFKGRDADPCLMTQRCKKRHCLHRALR